MDVSELRGSYKHFVGSRLGLSPAPEFYIQQAQRLKMTVDCDRKVTSRKDELITKEEHGGGAFRRLGGYLVNVALCPDQLMSVA
ncbi:hypothetical protein [Arthrobacter sp. MYb221]|uniref:hypothetical protein n=1 Tax=Arthrobacter sp. MYb221 TaxID=1848598 RepID=UPI0021573062|nr:hypothetical protein [Arthrobacter sp. MYb221]